MKCVIINILYPPIIWGGAEKSVALLAAGLVRRGHEVTVISLHSKDNLTVEELEGVTVYRLPLDNSYWPHTAIEQRGTWPRIKWHSRDIWNSKSAHRVSAILKEVKPDIVHTNNLRGMSVSVWAAARQLGLPVVHTLRDYSVMCVYSAMFRSGKNCMKQCAMCYGFSVVKKRESKKIEGVISISQAVLTAHHNAGFFPGVKAGVIFNIGQNASKKVNVSTDPDILSFGYIGRVEPMKGIEIALRAAARMKPGKWRFVIAGSGNDDYVANLKQEFSREEIVWLGFVDAMEYYSRIDVSIVPSIWAEPLSRAVLESFSFGKSVICSRAGGIPESAALGKQVASYPAEDVDALAAILSAAIDDPATWKTGGFASAEAEAEVSEASVVKKYVDAYELAIADKRRVV